jgi:hypothetical protein
MMACALARRGIPSGIEIRLADFYALELHAPGGRDAKDRLSR